MVGAVPVLSRYFLFITACVFAVCFIFCVLGAAVPQWIVLDSPSAISFGLFDTCVSHTCRTSNYPVTIWSNGGSCSRDGGELADRLEISSAFIIGGIVVQGILAFFMFLALNHWIMPTKAGWAVITLFSGLVCLGYFIGFILASVTWNNWLFCDTDYCSALGPTIDCGFGFSWVCGIIIIIASLVATIFLILSLVISGAQAHHNCRAIAILVILCCMVAAILCVATPHWIAYNQSRTSLGLFQWCVGGNCNSNNYNDHWTRGGNTCRVSGGTLQARMNGTAALVFLAAIGNLIMCIIFCLLLFGCLPLSMAGTMKIVTLVATFFIGVLLSIGMVLYHHTMNSYYRCGQDYCYQWREGCGYGFSFAICLLALIFLILLWFLHLFEYNQWLFFSTGGGGYNNYGVGGGGRSSAHSKTTTTTTTTTYSSSSSSRTVRKKNGANVALPNGEWVFDRDSGYYWSEKRGVFWDADSEMYYNPDNENWFH